MGPRLLALREPVAGAVACGARLGYSPLGYGVFGGVGAPRDTIPFWSAGILARPGVFQVP